ncbi:Acg family FMN-binding oxidoreductase [Labrys monachus]|uniref:Nitroreductase n=1 Tax=Labrys monachus TaxID=217067 RepID=A0ABU0F812_9HYPH|nr:nitroreductase family protein [Labrys monachus]MDQ0390681.1 nitroreductase [Labrys monachus]
MNRRNLLITGASALAAAGAGAFAWSRATGSMAGYEAYAKGLRMPLAAEPDLRDLVRYATLAASGHNTQPWRFAVAAGAVRLFPDESRRTPVVDPDDHHLFVSLGCAAENLAVAGRATGRPGEIAILPGDGSALAWSFSEGPAVADPLFDAIPRRQSTRADYDGRPIPSEDLAALERIAAEPGVGLVLLTDRARISQARDLVAAGNDAQMADPAFRTELERWIRFNPRSAMRSGDGLFSAASGSPSLPDVLGRSAFSAFVTAGSESPKVARQLASSAALAVFVGEQADPAHWIRVGRACQRLMLAATARGLKHAFVNQPVEVAGLRPALAALIGEPGRRPDIVLRLGYGPTLPLSPRRPVAAVLV